MNLDEFLYLDKPKDINKITSYLDSNIGQIYKKEWDMGRGEMVKGKLHVLDLVKEAYGREEYLGQIRIPQYRIALTKMRISAHKFPIETDRYIKLPRDERLCPLGCLEIGDEAHYLLKCEYPSLAQIRIGILDQFKSINPNFCISNESDKLKLLLNPPNPESAILASKLCYKLQKRFKDITY